MIRSLKFGLALSLLMLAGAAGASAQQVLKVATNAVPSYLGGFDPKTKQFTGLAVEFLQAVAADAKLSIEFVAMPSADQLPALKAKKIDIIASDLSLTADPNLDKAVEIGNIYASYRDVLVVKSTNKTYFKSADTLNGMTIAIVKGTDFAEELPKLGIKVKTFDKTADILAAVEGGAAEGALLYSHYAKEAMADNAHPNLMIVDPYQPPIRKWDMAFLMQKGIGVTGEKINDSIQKILFGPAGSKIAYKWGAFAEKSFLSEPCICAGP